DSGGKKKISALGTEAATPKVLAGPDPAFRLGEVYVFPNPAKNGAAPTFHMECGIADKVTIKIYTISGRPAHEYTFTGAPAAIDDGNGLSYAYEYAWSGRIPSGVYYYYLETPKKPGKT
ncbi:MAG: T9SS type A sorting domain-containing protein, partial [Elusimicrobia bacterium]|nr:T9SS type A sorting domain-containing protein [Elusimicrobiota bacterium]